MPRKKPYQSLAVPLCRCPHQTEATLSIHFSVTDYLVPSVQLNVCLPEDVYLIYTQLYLSQPAHRDLSLCRR